jgi:hypothetical protein
MDVLTASVATNNFCCVATCSLNQWAMDFDGNLRSVGRGRYGSVGAHGDDWIAAGRQLVAENGLYSLELLLFAAALVAAAIISGSGPQAYGEGSVRFYWHAWR